MLKVLIFAHIPPPYHGQSVAVRRLLDGLGGDRRKSPRCEVEHSANIACYHVDARVSDDITQVSAFALRKVFRLIGYCVEAIWCRFRFGVTVFYYIPAPPKRVPFLRDCLVMLLCRPFFRRVVLHWHACGLTEWLETKATRSERWLAKRLLSRPALSLVLSPSLAGDARWLDSARIVTVANGVPDPCPEFDRRILPLRAERQKRLSEAGADAAGEQTYRVLFLGHCTRSKGLFDTSEAVALLNQQLKEEQAGLKVELAVAGRFLDPTEQAEFKEWQQSHPDQAQYLGFVSVETKERLLEESDCFCFPTYYYAEAQPSTLIEAMACGLSVVTTHWRGIPEMLPPAYFGLAALRNPPDLSLLLRRSMTADVAHELRQKYLSSFTEEIHLAALARAFAAIKDE